MKKSKLRSPFKNQHVLSKDLQKVHKEFLLDGIFYHKKFKIADEENSYLYETKNSRAQYTTLILTLGMDEKDLLLAKMLHESVFAPYVVYLGKSFMLTKDSGKKLKEWEKEMTQEDNQCVKRIVSNVVQELENEFDVFHCHLMKHQVVINGHYEITIVDWKRSQYIPGLKKGASIPNCLPFPNGDLVLNL